MRYACINRSLCSLLEEQFEVLHALSVSPRVCVPICIRTVFPAVPQSSSCSSIRHLVPVDEGYTFKHTKQQLGPRKQGTSFRGAERQEPVKGVQRSSLGFLSLSYFRQLSLTICMMLCRECECDHFCDFVGC